MFNILLGPINAIKAALGIPASSTIAAKIDTLHDDRLTEDRADALDLLVPALDATISSRASSAEVAAVGPRWYRQQFTSSGTFVVPAAFGILQAYVMGVGGGGGGGKGASGVGGGGGGAGRAVWGYPVLIDMSLGNLAVTIPAAANGATSDNSAGSNGGDVTLGSILTLEGGKGGGAATGGNGSNNTKTGGAAGNPGVEGGEYTSWSFANSSPPDPPYAASMVEAILMPRWDYDGAAGGGGGTPASSLGGSGGDHGHPNLYGAATQVTSASPASAYEGGSGGCSAYGAGGKREGATGVTNVVTPTLGAGGAGGVGGVINGQAGALGFLDIYYFL